MSNAARTQQHPQIDPSTVGREHLTVDKTALMNDDAPFPSPFTLRQDINQEPLSSSQHSLFLALCQMHTAAISCAETLPEASTNLHQLVKSLKFRPAEFGAAQPQAMGIYTSSQMPIRTESCKAAKFKLIELLYEICKGLGRDELQDFAAFAANVCDDLSMEPDQAVWQGGEQESRENDLLGEDESEEMDGDGDGDGDGGGEDGEDEVDPVDLS
ncbi:hypothetical protein JHW43_003869 [Diplocarpon mali]|nr:hypothetical protein JHW43_003869 [Diplocarpon mali]